jgi:hypothetical protein
MRPYGLECSQDVNLKESKRLLRTWVTHLFGLLWFRVSSIGLLFLCLADLGVSADRDSPRNLQELNDSYPSIERDENSAEVYLRAFEELARDVKTGTWTNLPLVDSVPLPLPGETLSSQHDAAISAVIARNQRAWWFEFRLSLRCQSEEPFPSEQWKLRLRCT